MVVQQSASRRPSKTCRRLDALQAPRQQQRGQQATAVSGSQIAPGTPVMITDCRCSVTLLLPPQGIAEKLNQASYTTGELFTTARRFMVVFTAHFCASITKLAQNIPGSKQLVFRCRNDTRIPLSDVVDCLSCTDFDAQALNMACERYICRLTPAAAATCLPAAPLVLAVMTCWRQLFGQEDRAGQQLLRQQLCGPPADAASSVDGAVVNAGALQHHCRGGYVVRLQRLLPCFQC